MLIRKADGQAEQLKMLILGQGGTGKSTVIRAITETFQHYNKLDILAKCATTGIAATDIGAYTLHSWASLTHNLPKDDGWLDRSSKASIDKRRTNIQGKEFLIVDEVSMEDKTTAYCLLVPCISSNQETFTNSHQSATPQVPFMLIDNSTKS